MFLIAVFGGQKTGKGPWQPEGKVRTLALFGGIGMDFREAQLPEGGTRITSWTLFGGTRVVAPKGMPVSVSGLSLLGGTGGRGATATEGAAPGAQGLRVTSYAVFGAFMVTDEP